jgi:hypothetical protein
MAGATGGGPDGGSGGGTDSPCTMVTSLATDKFRETSIPELRRRVKPIRFRPLVTLVKFSGRIRSSVSTTTHLALLCAALRSGPSRKVGRPLPTQALLRVRFDAFARSPYKLFSLLDGTTMIL